MRRPFIAGNWKMNLDRAGAVALAAAIAERAGDVPQRRPGRLPAVRLPRRRARRDRPARRWPAARRTCTYEPNGAFTGEISAAMLRRPGLPLRHPGPQRAAAHPGRDRRGGATRRPLAALAAGLTPIVCVGELLAEREAGQTGAVIRRQFDGSLAGLSAEQIGRIVIAYEPVWAIGTGKVATPEQAEEVHMTFARCWPSATMRPWPRRSGFSTAAASSQTMRPSCWPSRMSTGPWSAAPA